MDPHYRIHRQAVRIELREFAWEGILVLPYPTRMVFRPGKTP